MFTNGWSHSNVRNVIMLPVSHNLQLHIKRVHKRLKPFICLECDYAACHWSNLQLHINSVHKRLKPFKCLKCDYATSESGNLNQHIHHVHDVCGNSNVRNAVMPPVNYVLWRIIQIMFTNGWSHSNVLTVIMLPADISFEASHN